MLTIKVPAQVTIETLLEAAASQGLKKNEAVDQFTSLPLTCLLTLKVDPYTGQHKITEIDGHPILSNL